MVYRLALSHNNIGNNLNCKVLAIKQPTTLTTTRTIALSDSSTHMDFSQIEIADGLRWDSPNFLARVEDASYIEYHIMYTIVNCMSL